MYSMVLMAAMLPSGDAAGFGKKNNGCHGATAGCNGTVVVAGCSGYVPAGCNGNSCHGSCHGDRGGFLGHRNRGNSCNGGGFLGKHHKNKGNSCNGGCSGYVPAGCNGGGIVTDPVHVHPTVVSPAVVAPEAMPPKK